jgi:hypothetical protein
MVLYAGGAVAICAPAVAQAPIATPPPTPIQAPVPPPVTPTAPKRSRAAGCRSTPMLVGKTFQVAQVAAAHAGCRLHVLDPARGQSSAIRLVAKATRRHGRERTTIDVQLDPLCSSMGAPGPPAGEPLVTSGPTELVSGLFIEGGALAIYSAPKCTPRVGTPSAGTLTVTSTATGAVVATQTVAAGALATFPLPPGSYTVSGTFSDSSGLTLPGTSVQVTAGNTVRQDVVVPVP